MAPLPKRSQADISKKIQALLNYVARAPGQNMEQIAKDLKSTTKALRLPMSKLIDEGAIVREGQRRASRYYPAGARVVSTVARKAKPARKTPRATKPVQKTNGASTDARLAATLGQALALAVLAGDDARATELARIVLGND